MLAMLNLVIFEAEIEAVLRCFHEDLRALERGQILLILKHKHGKFIEKLIVDGIENISTALTAVRSS